MIHVESNLGPSLVAAELLERAAAAVLAHESTQGDLTVVLTGDDQLQELNRQYLGIDAPTDVLSFPASEIDPDSRTAYLGDVLISIPRAEAQAEAAGHPLQSEVQLLVVHGVLHLLGFDHAGTEDRARMWSVQGEVLERIGLGGIRISEA
jgi:probable rRNA maturation factor